MTRIAGPGLLAVAFSLSVVSHAGAVQNPQPGRQSENQQSSSVKKTKRPARTLSEQGILETRILLDQLGYWVNVDVTGNDVSLRHALIASQKIEGHDRTGVLTVEELESLRDARRPQVLETGYPHIEIDLHRQVLFIVDVPGSDLRILPISSGSGEFFTEGGETRQAVTPTGRFKVYRKIEGWRKSPLGLLYYPNYVYDGIAIHGNPSVPVRPAIHGCIRIPMLASREFNEIATIGMVVIVHDSDPLAEADAESMGSVNAKKQSTFHALSIDGVFYLRPKELEVTIRANPPADADFRWDRISAKGAFLLYPAAKR